MLDVLFLSILVPIIGTVVRYRATYYPKHGNYGPASDALPVTLTPTVISRAEAATTAVQPAPGDQCGPLHVKVDVEEAIVEPAASSSPDAGSCGTAPTFLSVFKKVWSEEKLEGIFKGVVPGLLAVLFSRGYVSPAPLSFSDNYYTILPYNIIYLLFMATTYRIITTHHKLRYSAPKEMLRLLFSDYERNHPLKSLYQSGLITPYLVEVLIDMFIVQPLYEKLGGVGPLLDHFDEEEWWKVFHHPVWTEWAKAAAYWLIAIVSTGLLAPVDVIVTRLAIRPLHDTSASAENKNEEKLLDAGHVAPPSYLSLTTEQTPYLGFKDCLDRIIKEEGLGPLYRSWLLTFIGCLVPVLR